MYDCLLQFAQSCDRSQGPKGLTRAGVLHKQKLNLILKNSISGIKSVEELQMVATYSFYKRMVVNILLI